MTSKPNAAPIVGNTARLIRHGEWTPCSVAEITPRHAILLLEGSLEIGEKIVACVRDVGAIAGAVSEARDGAYVVAFDGASPDLAARMPNCYGRA